MLPCGGEGRQARQRSGGDRHRARGDLGHRHGRGRPVSGGSGHGHAQRDLQHQPFGRGPRGAALPRGKDERGIRQRTAEGDGRAAGGGAVPAHSRFAGRRAAHHPQPLHQLCARYCTAQGVDKKTAALYSELFDGHIGTVLAAAQDEARTAQVEKALQLAKTAADRDSYAAAVLLAPYEKDKAGAAALLTDFRAVAAAGLRQSPHAPVQGDAARRALRLADAAIQRLGAQVNPKIVLSVFAAKFRAL